MTVTHRSEEPQVPKRTVIIGARGFIGAAIERGMRGRGYASLPLTSADIDLTSPSALEKLQSLLHPDDAVVMLAGLTPDKGKDTATLMKNLVMMHNLCAALEVTGCAHLVYVSSDAVYDLAVSLVNEETPPSPQDLYGVMHYARELMARGLSRAPVMVLRPTLVYGLEDTHNSYGANRFRRAAEKGGRIALFGGGEETRDHVHVDDVAELTIRCLLRKSTGTMNVVTGKSYSFRHVAEIVARQFAGPIEIVGSPRANPVTHRSYDSTALIKAFPEFHFRELADGIASVHRAASSSFQLQA